MLLKRVIPCLDVKDGRVVKGVRFVDLTDEGDPPELARRYVARRIDAWEGRRSLDAAGAARLRAELAKLAPYARSKAQGEREVRAGIDRGLDAVLGDRLLLGEAALEALRH